MLIIPQCPCFTLRRSLTLPVFFFIPSGIVALSFPSHFFASFCFPPCKRIACIFCYLPPSPLLPGIRVSRRSVFLRPPPHSHKPNTLSFCTPPHCSYCFCPPFLPLTSVSFSAHNTVVSGRVCSICCHGHRLVASRPLGTPVLPPPHTTFFPTTVQSSGKVCIATWPLLVSHIISSPNVCLNLVIPKLL